MAPAELKGKKPVQKRFVPIARKLTIIGVFRLSSA